MRWRGLRGLSARRMRWRRRGASGIITAKDFTGGFEGAGEGGRVGGVGCAWGIVIRVSHDRSKWPRDTILT